MNCSIKQLIEDEYTNDSFIQKTLSLLWNSTWKLKKIMLSECQIWFNKLYYQNHLMIPDHNKLKLKLLHYVHEFTGSECMIQFEGLSQAVTSVNNQRSLKRHIINFWNHCLSWNEDERILLLTLWLNCLV